MKKVFIVLLPFFAACILSAGSWQAPDAEILPAAGAFPYPSSASRWLWFQSGQINGKSRAYFRYTLHLDEDVKSAWAYVLMDDQGTMQVNGQRTRYNYPPQPGHFQIKIPRHEFGKLLKKGKNVLSFEVYNNVSTGGLFLRGEVTLADGKKIPLISDRRIKASAKAEKNWRSEDFDDSSWTEAKEFGDALTEPWDKASDILEFGLTEDEKAAYKAHAAEATKISASIDKEPLPEVKLDLSRLVPGIRIGNKVIPPILNIPGDPFVIERADMILKFARAGIKLNEVTLLDYDAFREEGFDFSTVDSHIRRILTLVPDAHLGVGIRFSHRNYLWMKNHPDELIKYPTGDDYENNDTLRRKAPSMASLKYRDEMKRFIDEFFKYAKKQPWYPRIVYCRVVNGCYKEWHYYGMRRDMPDISAPMTGMFRKFLTGRYRTDNALQKAWHDPSVTLKTAQVPGIAKRHGKGNFLRDPGTEDRQAMDYYECMQQVIADTMLFLAETVKSHAPHILVGAYYGYVLQMNFPPEGQTILLDKVLSSPHIDFLSAPICYDSSRSPDGDGLKRTIPQIFARHRKLHIVEQDTRTHITYPKLYTPAHSAMLFARDTASAWLDGCGTQVLSIHGTGQRHWMNSPEILASLREGLNLWEKLHELPAQKRTAHKAAVVFNIPEMYLHGYPTVEQQKVPIQMLTTEPLHALHRSGHAFDLYDLRGFLESEQNYQAVILLNVFTADKSDLAALKKKLHRPGVTAFWHYAPGLVGENVWSPTDASDLTGIDLALINGGKLAIKGIPLKQDISLSPRLTVTDRSAVKKLPYADAQEYIGMAEKKLPSGATAVFSGAPITDPHTWHKLLNDAGLKPFTVPGQVILGFGNRLLVPMHKKNSVEVTLPAKSGKITELISGDPLPAGAEKVVLKSSGPSVYLIEW